MDDLRALIAEPHRELINISAELVTAKWLLSEYREDHTGMVTRATMRKIRDQNDAARECALRLRKAADKLPGLLDRLAAVERDADYLRWRLAEILPLFEEARDALPAINTASARLHGVDLTLGDRMDSAGTRTREDWDAAIAARKGEG